MTLTEFKRFADENNIVPVSTEIYSQMISDSVKYAKMKEILQEIRQEIVGFRDDAEIRYGHQLGFDKIYAYERCIDLIDGKIKELSE